MGLFAFVDSNGDDVVNLAGKWYVHDAEHSVAVLSL